MCNLISMKIPFHVLALRMVIILIISSVCGYKDVHAQQTQLTLVTSPYPPFVNPEGDPVGEGIDIDIAREALSRGGYQIKVVMVPWKRALNMLRNGQADLTTTISKNEDRDSYLAWTQGYRNSVEYRFYGKKGDTRKLTTLKDLEGLRIGITLGYFYPDALVKRQNVSYLSGNTISNTVQMLTKGRSDFILVNNIAGLWEINKLGLTQELELQALKYHSDSPTYMAFSRQTNFEKPLNVMMESLKQMAKDGSIQRIEKKYITDKAN